MAYIAFTDGASRGNPGHAGLGIVLYENKELKEQISEYLGKMTNNEAEYYALIRALERVKGLGESSLVVCSDSEFLVKQLRGEYKVKSEKIKPLYEKVKELQESIQLSLQWVPREENKEADSLANQAIDQEQKQQSTTSASSRMILEKAFFGKINCFKVLVNTDNEVYFHLGLLQEKKKEWGWEKAKMNDMELGEIVALLRSSEGSASFYHSFQDKKTQIWCKRDQKGLNLKINDWSKNLSVGESEVIRILLEEIIKRRNFSH